MQKSKVKSKARKKKKRREKSKKEFTWSSIIFKKDKAGLYWIATKEKKNRTKHRTSPTKVSRIVRDSQEKNRKRTSLDQSKK